MAPSVEPWICVGSAESVEVGTADAKSRNPNDSVSTSTLSIVEQLAVAPVPAVQIVTLASGEFARLNCVNETTTGTVLAAVFAVGVAVGVAELTVFVVAVVLVAGVVVVELLVVLPVAEVDDEPPPPPPQAARPARSAATNARAMICFMFVVFIAGRLDWCLVGVLQADRPGP